MEENDVVIAIAASLYASRATDDALRAEPPIEALANEAWDLYYKLERAEPRGSRSILLRGLWVVDQKATRSDQVLADPNC
jgi:hypothetical protein